MKLYLDKNLANQIFDDISFGKVPVGESKEITIWAQNNSSPRRTGYLENLTWEVQCLDPETDRVIEEEEVLVTEAPPEMSPMSIGAVTLKWSPNVNLEIGLKAKLLVKGDKVIG